MESVWTNSVKEIKKTFPTLMQDISTDVLVVGGGMAGILTAHRLKEKGISCVLVEARSIGEGNTGNTTGKVTAQHGLIYGNLIKKYGHEKARLYYEANMFAVDRYHDLAQAFPCDYEHKTAYVYSTNNRKKIEAEAKAYEQLGIHAAFLERPPLPFDNAPALGMSNQAQFNPLKLLVELSRNLEIYENTCITDVEENVAVAEHGRIYAKHIILATHFPMVSVPGLYFLKMYQHRSYAIALQDAPDINGMFIDEKQNGFSFRNYEDLLIIGGGDHRTGKKGGGYRELSSLASSVYPSSVEIFAWAAQDCMTLDQMPYIGIHRNTSVSTYVATGFNKWGMTGSMVAAHVLTDLILHGKSEWSALFSPQRSMLHGQLLKNIGHAFSGTVQFGKRCPHLGCALKWNGAEKTWDCPCHGSRFDRKGNLIDNPAKRGIHIE